MTTFRKKSASADHARRLLEPGPVVLVSSAHRGERNVMTLGWHMMLGYDTVGVYIWDQNDSWSLIRGSRECVINVPTAELARAVVGIGNCHGSEGDKFDRFGLTAVDGDRVGAPMIAECYANLECRLVDTSLIKRYSLFVLEVVKAHVATSPRWPATLHYRGDGQFMIAGRNVSYRRWFKPEMLA